MTVASERKQGVSKSVQPSTAPLGTELLRSSFGFATRLARSDAQRTGKALRERVPRKVLGGHTPRPPSVAMDVVIAGNAGRLERLIPLRMGRLAASPFAFLRGAAAVMAHDLDGCPRTGLVAQLCGDAHLSNFGFYASPERRVVMDINDFDETVHGSFELDLKRLVASVIVAARSGMIGTGLGKRAALSAVAAYRRTMRNIARMPVLEAWHLSFDNRLLDGVCVHAIRDLVESVMVQAQSNDSRKVASKWTTRNATDGWRFVEEPPVLTRVNAPGRAALEDALVAYAATLPEDRRVLLSRFSVADMAFRVVGVGSVGTRAYIALLQGNANDALVLQIKEARASVFAGKSGCHVPTEDRHDGKRVVHGLKIMQTVSDAFLGWTTIARRPYYVRTFRDMKGGIDVSRLKSDQLDDYAQLCGALLARAHARSVDPRVLAGYVGRSDELDRSLLAFGTAYADQTEADHGALVRAIKSGKIAAELA